MSIEVRNLELEKKETQPQRTWKNKIFNWYLPLAIWFYAAPVLTWLDEKKKPSFWGAIVSFGFGLLFTYEYLNSSGFLDKPYLQAKRKSLEARFEKVFKDVFELIGKVIAWGFVIAIFCGLGFLAFQILGSLSGSTLLIIIIVILLLK